LILCGQIYGPGLGRHGPTKAWRGLGPGWATVFTLRAGTTRPKNCLGFLGPKPFDTKHDGLEPGRPGTAQFPALALAIGGHVQRPSIQAASPAEAPSASVPPVNMVRWQVPNQNEASSQQLARPAANIQAIPYLLGFLRHYLSLMYAPQPPRLDHRRTRALTRRCRPMYPRPRHAFAHSLQI
jgi:hypothetical protein